MIEYTDKEMTDAYSRLLWAQGLIDFVLRAGFDLTSDPAETEGSLISSLSLRSANYSTVQFTPSVETTV